MRFLEAATEDQISQFEKENEIQFPTQYKEWLQYSDGVNYIYLLESSCTVLHISL